ncbi:glycosyltransferase family 2 protein [Microbacterium trichothecenolyticum]|uniref:Undecaprenyl-phosphate 4-deoxy-4-formamido-L-arabinose transferase n=1 Tax=Microbacterium trichothecenolyticum TaxID=69370 RepID=A0A0M2H465_MICTR|nr:glycosyltransferase [Microbacterium trichothecenolyticum]KJL41232.1 Undecaprenyl-phosphate 4-deoxy-4-formamido-L-arabinose transferase [Microbacterium trichothecenolyticum]
MSSPQPGARAPRLSVVIPSYNSAQWLPSTLSALADAVRDADVATEVIVVDDGSTDDTPAAVTQAAASFPGDLRVMTQPNRGRFLARWAGIQAAAADLVLLLDSRVLVHRGALRHVLAGVAAEPSRTAWNAVVVTDPAAPLVGLFWEVPTHVFWGRYLRSPRVLDLTGDNFDEAPKGTTMFLARKDVLIDAFEFAWPDGDTKLVSDDTKVLRRIAQLEGIRLDPGFSATYRPRTTLRGFLAHTLDRGTLFVDSYAGTTLARSVILIALALAPILLIALVVVLFVVGSPAIAWAICIAVVALALLPAVIAAFNRCRGRAILAFVVGLPLFVFPFWLGLVRGIFIHRESFVRSRQSTGAIAPRTERR